MGRIVAISLLFLAVAITAVILMLGLDARRAASRGPRWCRWMLSLGLAGLAALGCDRVAAEAPQPTPDKNDPAPPAPASAWPAIDAAFAYARPLATSGKSTSAERRTAREKLDRAIAAAEALVAKGGMSATDLSLLKTEAETLDTMIRRDPPTDQQVKCYKRAFVPPARRSVERLEKRLPLVERMLTSGQVNPKVVDKVVQTMEQDLRILEQERDLGRLEPGERVKAEQTRDAMKVHLEQLRQATKDAR